MNAYPTQVEGYENVTIIAKTQAQADSILLDILEATFKQEEQEKEGA